MTDFEKQPIPEEVPGGPSVSEAAPPPYPTALPHMLPPPSYQPPPYPPNPAVYPAYPPIEATCGTGPIPPPAYPVYPPMQGGCVEGNLPPEEGMAAPITAGSEGPGAQDLLMESLFEDKTVRRAFIRKVFSVVTLQLLVTFSVVCVFTFSGTVKTAVQRNIWVYISSYIIFMLVAVCLSIFSSFSRLYPWNFIGLSVVTLSLSYMVGTVASFHDTRVVVIAMGATLIISFTIIIFSAQTRVDFTICNGILTILAVDLLMFGLFSIFFYSNVLQILYGCLGALLYSLFLAVDCQLVMGRQKYSLNPEEYVFAALIIYLDIIIIFLYILIILGGGSKN